MAWRGDPWHDRGVQVLITGIGDAFSALSHGSSAVIRGPEGLLAIDCPGSVMAMYRAASSSSSWDVSAGTVDDIFLTHLHGDHSNGIEVLGFARRYLDDPPRRPRLHAISEVIDRLWEKLAPAMDGATRKNGATSDLEQYFEIHVMEPGRPAVIAGLEVHCRRGVHSVPVAGLVVRDDQGCFGWSSDTEFIPEHVDWLAQADCIVHECGGQFKHTSWEELDTLPEELKKRIRLIHVPDGVVLPEGPMRRLDEGEVLSPTSIVRDQASR